DRKRDCKTPVRCCHPVKTRYQRKVWPLAPSHETGSWHPHPFARHIPTSAICHAPSAAPSYTTTQGLSIRQITSICGSGPEGGGPNRAQPRFLDEAQFPSNQAAARRGKVLPLRLRRGAYAATTAMISTSIRKPGLASAVTPISVLGDGRFMSHGTGRVRSLSTFRNAGTSTAYMRRNTTSSQVAPAALSCSVSPSSTAAYCARKSPGWSG